jgi:hypothetical protein
LLFLSFGIYLFHSISSCLKTSQIGHYKKFLHQFHLILEVIISTEKNCSSSVLSPPTPDFLFTQRWSRPWNHTPLDTGPWLASTLLKPQTKKMGEGTHNNNRPTTNKQLVTWCSVSDRKLRGDMLECAELAWETNLKWKHIFTVVLRRLRLFTWEILPQKLVFEILLKNSPQSWSDVQTLVTRGCLLCQNY